ncbi:hypothetical protein Cgig2_027005 [Carnegiea gigantea]|uniref:Uncharacterized protein n=1 Tax=Carnegiea gigantea TaxID=171969 RepID=A0A9Q1JW93_9CARY|nr:hypothetical protein Cgig2_027005 [Carnegiea gigantea]
MSTVRSPPKASSHSPEVVKSLSFVEREERRERIGGELGKKEHRRRGIKEHREERAEQVVTGGGTEGRGFASLGKTEKKLVKTGHWQRYLGLVHWHCFSTEFPPLAFPISPLPLQSRSTARLPLLPSPATPTPVLQLLTPVTPTPETPRAVLMCFVSSVAVVHAFRATPTPETPDCLLSPKPKPHGDSSFSHHKALGLSDNEPSLKLSIHRLIQRELVAMDIEGQGNEIHANENLNSISIITALGTLVEDDKKRSSVSIWRSVKHIKLQSHLNEEVRKARVIIRHEYSFSWIEHEGNREIHTYLNNEDLRLDFSDSLMDLMRDARFRRLLRLWLLLLAHIWRPRRVAFLLLL